MSLNTCPKSLLNILSLRQNSMKVHRLRRNRSNPPLILDLVTTTLCMVSPLLFYQISPENLLSSALVEIQIQHKSIDIKNTQNINISEYFAYFE